MRRQDLRNALYLSTLTPSERFLFMALENHADETGECWPSIAALALMTGQHRSTVIRALNGLESAGWIVTKRSPNAANTYRLTPVDNPGDSPIGWSHSATPVVAQNAVGSRTVRPGREQRREQRRGAAARSTVDNRGGGAITDARGTFLPGTGWIS